MCIDTLYIHSMSDIFACPVCVTAKLRGDSCEQLAVAREHGGHLTGSKAMARDEMLKVRRKWLGCCNDPSAKSV